jgi:hypothetical protein
MPREWEHRQKNHFQFEEKRTHFMEGELFALKTDWGNKWPRCSDFNPVLLLLPTS